MCQWHTIQLVHDILFNMFACMNFLDRSRKSVSAGTVEPLDYKFKDQAHTNPKWSDTFGTLSTEEHSTKSTVFDFDRLERLILFPHKCAGKYYYLIHILPFQSCLYINFWNIIIQKQGINKER